MMFECYPLKKSGLIDEGITDFHEKSPIGTREINAFQTIMIIGITNE